MTRKMKTALVFPGQGSQYVGMGQDLVTEYAQARAVFDRADAALGIPLSQICFSGPADVLTDTINAQPALLTHSIASLRVLQSISPHVSPAFTAGHSFAEYSALVASDAIDFDDALQLVRTRGTVMKESGAKAPGAMAAVLGMSDNDIEAVCREAGVQVANYNAPGQIVISGAKSALDSAIALAKTRGARRIVLLAVSIAAHSRLMESGVAEFADAVARTPLRVPSIPVIANVSARPLTTVDEIREELVAQLTSPVQWVKSIEYIVSQGVTEFVEVGPKDILAGLIRRINKDVHAISVGDVASMKTFGESLNQGA